MTQTTEPTDIVAGTTLAFTKSLADYPASSGWALSYVLVNAAGRQTFNASAAGSDFAVTVAASTTQDWAAGTYSLQGFVTKSGETFTVVNTTMKVLPNVVTGSGGVDTRSHAKKVLDALEALLEGKASQDQKSLTIAGRSISRMDVKDLLDWRDKYRAEVAKEAQANDVAAGKAPRNRIKVYL